jgi:Flp pilus assembly protein TadG
MSFRFKTGIMRFLREERGAIAVAVAVLLTGVVGITGAATDLGVVYTARGQLQNAADSAALGAAKNMMAQDPVTLDAITTPEEAQATAHLMSNANKALGDSITLLDTDYTIGFWDLEAEAFTRTGPSSDPNDINAVEVTLRKDDLANSPVTTMFAGVVGISQVDVSAKSLAFVGYPMAIPEDGGLGIPIAIKESAVNPGGGPACGTQITFSDENSENASWHTFDRWPANSRTVDYYICACYEPGYTKLGDYINLINGKLSNNVFQHLRSRFEHEGVDSDGDGHLEWVITIPVVPDEANSGPAEVLGFTTFEVEEVHAAPLKMLRGIIRCNTIINSAETGGPNFGARAGNPKLVATNN